MSMVERKSDIIHEDAHKADPVVLQAILSRIYGLVDDVRLVRKELLQRISNEIPGHPGTVVVHPSSVLVIRSARADAIGAIRARIDEGTKVAQAHLTCEPVHDLLLLHNHVQDEYLKAEVRCQKEEAAEGQCPKGSRPTCTSGDLRHDDGCIVDGGLQ
eukprot:CAMPEP_0177423866 /NCGR_PEP_ID=MMETSP0368-20130122/72128_1 /TAXON_ID=447022 ORGANISM="Scrippsiella hangoei-like, Strain SHHI-4" /NCGR_SAMPLE_ID=MMETSP0368 /ASSEMBLY_ACC=CAM_ASM_000363 /LENGTH=157 /DNA_ID=CAMNT_0018893975 /DNA_START=137 /DNA_END=610 /DNA_ORIENTATION=-